MKGRRRPIAMPGVPVMADPDQAAPATKPCDDESERPADELTEELTRTVKAAYQ
jgi:hypothetical protein